MQRLYIDGIDLSNTSAIKIFTLLKEKNTKLKWLSLANNKITDYAYPVIAKALQVNGTVDYLKYP